MEKKNEPRSAGSAAAGAVLTPAWWLPAIFFLTLPFLYSEQISEPENSVRYLAFGIALVAGLALILLFPTASGKTIPMHPVIYWLGAFLGIALLSCTYSLHKWEALYEWSKYFMQAAGLLLWLMLFRNSRTFIRPLVVLSVISFGLLFAYACYRLFPLLSDSLSAKELYVLQRALHSSFSNKNFYAEALFMLSPFLAAGAMLEKGPVKMVSVLSLFLTLLLLAFIQSLAVVIAVVAAALICVLLWYKYIRSGHPLKKNQILKILVIAAFGMSALGFAAYRSGAIGSFSKKAAQFYSYLTLSGDVTAVSTTANDNSVYDRMLMSKRSFQMISDYPIGGCGLGDWKILIPTYGIEGSPFLASGRLRYEHPHNEYLAVWCEMGPAGLVAWLGLLLYAIYRIRKKLRLNSSSKETKIMLMLVAAGIIGFMIISLFSYPKERFFSMFLLMLLLAIVVHLTGESDQDKKKISKPMLFTALLLITATTLLHTVHVKSEVLMRAAQERQVNREFTSMLRYVQKAQNPFFPLDNTSTPLRWYEGMAYYYLGDSLSAMRNYKLAANDNPYHIQVWSDLAATQEKCGLYPEAMESIHRVFDINPDYPEALFNASIIHLKSGNTDSALYFLEAYPHKQVKRYHPAMAAILAEVVGRRIRATQDTLLLKVLNDSITTDHEFLERYYNANKHDTLLLINVLEKMR